MHEQHPDTHTHTHTPKLSGISQKLLVAYCEWQKYQKHIPKILRYSMAVRIDGLFAEVSELVALAMFTAKEHREVFVSRAIGKNNTLKFMLYALFELKGIDEKHFADIGCRLEEVGKMLFGWKNQLLKQNHPTNTVSSGNKKE